MNNDSWNVIFEKHNINIHTLSKTPYIITAKQIKDATSHFSKTNEKEVRILCKQDSRENRPDIFVKHNLFLLPIKNGTYAIIKGEGYVDIPEITHNTKIYKSKLDFHLDTSQVGNSEMQHLDFAYASSLLRTFLQDESLVLTVRGRKYTPSFSFMVGSHTIKVEGVQTEVDAGYEGRKQVVLVEAKNSEGENTIIRQLFYPYKQWSHHTKKPIKTLFFEKRENEYLLWQFRFKDAQNYNSIELIKSRRYSIKE